jgi:hypothetical protein
MCGCAGVPGGVGVRGKLTRCGGARVQDQGCGDAGVPPGRVPGTGVPMCARSVHASQLVCMLACQIS